MSWQERINQLKDHIPSTNFNHPPVLHQGHARSGSPASENLDPISTPPQTTILTAACGLYPDAASVHSATSSAEIESDSTESIEPSERRAPPGKQGMLHGTYFDTLGTPNPPSQVGSQSSISVLPYASNFTIGAAYFIDNSRAQQVRDVKEEKQGRNNRERRRREGHRHAEQVRRSRAENERKKRAQKERYRRVEEMRVEKERQIEEGRQTEKALEELRSRAMTSAILDSQDRELYIPRCHEDTRKLIRRRIIGWRGQDEDVQRLFWLSGPAGVGKSAVAQSVAEELKEQQLLGAVFFFSRPNKRDDPNVVIPTLSYQLALLLSQYRTIVTKRIARDPVILNKSRRTQFKELIIDPFYVIMSQQYILKPAINHQKSLLIVLDGLDECSDRAAQLEFVEMIAKHSPAGNRLPLRWLVCSRPEAHLKVAFTSSQCQPTCLRERLEVDDDEARQDAIRILEAGFADIKKKYPDQLKEDWPRASQVSYIADRASGHLGFASFIIRFIGDDDYEDPSGQLNACLRFLQLGGKVNPLLSLDLLYQQILSGISNHLSAVTRRILVVLILYSRKDLTVLLLANFLGLDQAIFYAALRRLHSVLLIPLASEAHVKPIHIYHASFSDFLKDPTRSGDFLMNANGGAVYSDIAIRGLYWLSYCSTEKTSDRRLLSKLEWNSGKISTEIILDTLTDLSFASCWKACLMANGDSLKVLLREIDKFDFHLPYFERWYGETEDFARFIRWLRALGPNYKSSVTVDRCYIAGDGNSQKVETTVWHRDDDPYAFVAPFLNDATHADYYSVYLRLGRAKPTTFRLAISKHTDPRFI